MHLFYVQGGGLGHLTRVDRVIKALNIPSQEILILTPSTFTNYFKAYKFIHLCWNDSETIWTSTITKIVEQFTISKFYVDTFPYGIKGELIPIYKLFSTLDFIYISRVLKWEEYLNDMPKVIPIEFLETIVLEPLYDTHRNWIATTSNKVTDLKLETKTNESDFFHESAYILVVHSGGKADVLKICNQAISDYKDRSEMTIIVCTQVDINLNQQRIIILKDEYPVSHYYKNAEKIYTAAGFNSIQELKAFRSKHVIIPLKKLYDDQFFRCLNSSQE